MLIHGDLRAHGPDSQYLEDLFNSEGARDGGFARVVDYTAATVLKATCCPATNKLFYQLLQKRETGIPTPHNLPAIVDSLLGQLVDADGFVYEVWEVEKLFGCDFYKSAAEARATQKMRFAELKPAYRGTLARTTSNMLEPLNAALASAKAALGDNATWQSSAEIALAMALQTTGTLRDTFIFLREFVVCHKVALDLLGQGNIMLNMFGEPCLADPVQGICDFEMEKTARSSGQCLGTLLPVKVEGRTVEMRPFVTFPLNETVFAEIEQKLFKAGLTSRAFDWNSPDLTAFIAQGPQIRSIHRVPDVARNLRKEAYLNILSD